MMEEKPTVSKRTAILLAIFLGLFGIHRLYLGRVVTGRVMMCLGIAACSITGVVASTPVDPISTVASAVLAVMIFIALGIWSLVDLIIIAVGKMPADNHHS